MNPTSPYLQHKRLVPQLLAIGIRGDPRAFVMSIQGVHFPPEKPKAGPGSKGGMTEEERLESRRQAVKRYQAKLLARGLTRAGTPRIRQKVNRNGLSKDRKAYMAVWRAERKALKSSGKALLSLGHS